MFCQSDKVTGWSWAFKKARKIGGMFFQLVCRIFGTLWTKNTGKGVDCCYLLRKLEEHIFTLACGAFHGHSVFAFAMDAYPCSAEIASSAQQQPPEPQDCIPMPVGWLGGRALFHFGRVYLERKCVLFTHLKPYKSLRTDSFNLLYGPLSRKSKEEAGMGRIELESQLILSES
jgi:hypothetical protein